VILTVSIFSLEDLHSIIKQMLLSKATYKLYKMYNDSDHR